MKLLIGLGNVGPKYAHTRHNVGFMVVDELAIRYGADWKHQPKLKADVAKIELDDGTLVLAKPGTMMNASGEAAARLIQHYRLKPVDVVAIYDDVDTAFGRLRTRTAGSAGGHQGVKSLISRVGPDFGRLRVGISLNDRATEPSEVYVLKPFTPDEQSRLHEVVVAAGEAALDYLAADGDASDRTIALI